MPYDASKLSDEALVAFIRGCFSPIEMPLLWEVAARLESHGALRASLGAIECPECGQTFSSHNDYMEH